MSNAQLQRAQEKSAAVTDHESKKPVIITKTAPAAKTKQPAGIMGMFSNRAGSKSDENKEVKTEQKDSPVSSVLLLNPV